MIFSPIGRVLPFLALLVSAWCLHSGVWNTTQVLVVLDPKLTENQEEAVSVFKLNEDYNVTTIEYSDSDAELFLGEDALYHHVVFLPSSKRAAAAKNIVNKHKLLDFFNKGGNIVAVSLATHTVPEEVRLFLAQAGIFPAPKGYAVASHFAPVEVDSGRVANSVVLPLLDPQTYKGTAALVSNSPLVFPLVKAPQLSFCASRKDEFLTEEKTWTVGEQGFLAAAFQGLNNGRGAWFGSESLLTRDALLWVFHERGVLKLQFVEHYRVLEPGLSNRTLYKVKDEVYYTVGVSEYVGGEWVPYVPNDDDALQLSFKMLDPYQRLNMTLLGPGSSTPDGPEDMSIFYVQFTIPDHHGMFTFELDYKRPGLSFLNDKRIVAVRHLANDEYKRSWEITNAWMYVASAGFVVIAWLVFVTIFLFIGDEKKVERKELEKETKEEEKPTSKAN